MITGLGSKDFTMLGVNNTGIHPNDQARAIFDLFDEEICITQSVNPLECKNQYE
jgi:hypothetical protein